MIPQRTPYFACQTPQGPMMLVSSSGWAHSPITLIFTALGAVYCAARAAGAQPTATAVSAARTTPKRLTSVPPRLPDRPSHARTLSHDFEQRSGATLSPPRRPCQPPATLGIVRLAVLFAAPAALVAPAAAQAAPTLNATVAKTTVGYGAHHTVNGTLADGLTPLAGQQV